MRPGGPERVENAPIWPGESRPRVTGRGEPA